jgi:hypothetical protein
VVDDTKLMQQQMDATAMMQQMDITKVYTSERENLEIVQHTWSAEDAEIRLVGGKKKERGNKKDL